MDVAKSMRVVISANGENLPHSFCPEAGVPPYSRGAEENVAQARFKPVFRSFGYLGCNKMGTVEARKIFSRTDCLTLRSST